MIGLALLCPGVGFSQDSHFASPYLSAGFDPTTPRFVFFSVDSLGRSALDRNVVLDANSAPGTCRLDSEGNNTFHYLEKNPQGNDAVAWQMELSDKQLILKSQFVPGVQVPSFLLLMKPDSFATLLANPVPETCSPGQQLMSVPGVLHIPEMGTLRVTSPTAGASLAYDARRKRATAYVKVEFPAATASQGSVEYVLNVVQIYPNLPGVASNPLYDAYRRDFLNLIQYNPRLKTVANNSASDCCGLCFYEYSELGLQAPPLAKGLTVLGLVRAAVERVLDGGLTYGQVGYNSTPAYPDAIRWSGTHDSLDTAPSILIAGCQYVEGTGDLAWGKAHFDRLAAMADQMLASDTTGDGLIKYAGSGNRGSLKKNERPANWWDNINFGYEDAYSNALAYRACLLMQEVATKLNRQPEADRFGAAARKIKAAYYPTFYDPQTGVLAGWKSADGELHDYEFTFLNGMAISFGLVDDQQGNALMDAMFHNLDQVGFNRFDRGLPGNLIPIRKSDYVPGSKRWGCPQLEDGSDSFQIYENGAATACHTYWTLHALYKLKRVSDARRIFYPMLKSYAAGGFSGRNPDNLTNDWSTWQGHGNGYEGFLSDNYLALLAVKDDLAAGP